MLLEQVFPECNDLDSYKLKKRYYKSAQIDLLPAMSVMGQEGTVLDYVWVVVGGKVDVLRLVKRSAEALSFEQNLHSNERLSIKQSNQKLDAT